MPPNQEHVHLVWPLWSDLRFIPTHGNYGSLEQPIPTLPVPPEGQANPLDVVSTHEAWVKAQKEIDGLMLMTMDPDIQKNLEHLGAYDMLKEPKTLYVQQADQEPIQTVRGFHACKQEEGQSVSSYVLKMKSYIDNLERLGHAMTQNLSISLILVSLMKEYDSFVQNYNMHSIGKTVTELHAMLKLHEQTLAPRKVAPALHAIRAGRIQKNQKNCIRMLKGIKGKAKQKWKKLSQGAELYTFPSTSWVYDTGCSTHIYVTTQGLWESRKLKPVALSLSMFAASNKRAKPNLDSALLWHCRLRHINKKRIEKLQHDGLLDLTNIKSFEKYVACMSGKMARKPYSHQVERAKDLLGLIHTDVCGPFKIMSRQGASYFVTFIDDFSRYGYVYLLKHKNEVFETFKVSQNEVENQLGKTIKSLRSHRGGEYMSQEFLDHLKERGIISHQTPPYTPQHNDYAIESAARILNMVPTKKVDKTPYKVWHGSIKCIFVGYPKETIGYSFYYPPENKVFVARNAEFFENSFINQEASGSLEHFEIIQEEDTHLSFDTSLDHEEDDQKIDEPQSDINPIPRSTRTCHHTDQLCLYVDAEEHELGNLDEPANYKAALLDPESDKWLNAMNVEMQSMKDNEVWILVAIAAFYDYEIWQIDVKTAFLNGYLNEEVHMKQPEGFVSQKFPNRTGYVFVLNGGAIDGKSKNLFATSSIDAEYIAAFDASKKAVWICKFISGLGVVPIIEGPINMYCDNTGAIAIAKDHRVTKGVRHFRAKVHYLRKTIEMGDVKIEKVDTNENLAEPFTKALAFPKHYELTEKIRMIPASSLIISASPPLRLPSGSCSNMVVDMYGYYKSHKKKAKTEQKRAREQKEYTRAGNLSSKCMRTINSYFSNNPSVTIPRRRNKSRASNVVEPELRTIIEVTPMTDNRTMQELLQAPKEGYGEAIVIPKINADHFENRNDTGRARKKTCCI
nr:retrotransposon protein, putative, Ty1-copia subclass [Tanacetum cinerariifolium]